MLPLLPPEHFSLLMEVSEQRYLKTTGNHSEIFLNFQKSQLWKTKNIDCNNERFQINLEYILNWLSNKNFYREKNKTKQEKIQPNQPNHKTNQKHLEKYNKYIQTDINQKLKSKCTGNKASKCYLTNLPTTLPSEYMPACIYAFRIYTCNIQLRISVPTPLPFLSTFYNFPACFDTDLAEGMTLKS